MSFQKFKLNAQLQSAVQKAGFKAPTPVQAETIPLALQGRDVMACAQTGTGKTAAFSLPLINKLLTTERPTNQPPKAPRAVILTPTRELAMQVMDSIKTLTKGTPIVTNIVVGGVSFQPQLKMLNRPLDILVATPGRLIDHLQQGTVNLKAVEILVLDEADRMLDMGFLKPVERIMQSLAQHRQTLLFSATIDKEIEELSKRFLDNPSIVKLAATTQKHTQITQSLYFTEGKDHKLNLLKELLENKEVWQAVVFMKTKHGSDKMAKKIEAWGHKAAALNGNMKQNARKRVIDQMHSGKLRVLVATDVAARGIDVKAITHVFNHDLPQVAEDYIHRIGRTGRAGAKGEAVSLIGSDDYGLLRDIEKLLGEKIKPLNEPSKPIPAGISGASKPAGKAGKGAGHRGGKRPTFGNKSNRRPTSAGDGNSDGFKRRPAGQESLSGGQKQNSEAAAKSNRGVSQKARKHTRNAPPNRFKGQKSSSKHA